MIHELGKGLIMIGIFLAAIGVVLLVAPKIPYIGRLPGDIVIKRGDFVLYFPLATSIIISMVLTIIFAIFRR